MNDDVKQVIDQVANALQVINLLSRRLRRDLGESAQHAIDLESATARAVRLVLFVRMTSTSSLRCCYDRDRAPRYAEG